MKPSVRTRLLATRWRHFRVISGALAEGVLIARIWMKASHTYDEKIEQARETILFWNEQAGAFSEELLQEDLRIPVTDLPMHLIELCNKLLDEVASATHWSTHMNQLLKDLTQ